MLSDSRASPQLESCPVPARLQTSPSEAAIPDYGYVSPRQQSERCAVTPDSSFQPPSRQQQRQQQQQTQQHGLNAPHPSLSPLSEYHSGYTDDDLGAPSPSTSPFPRANHLRQNSFPNLLPLALRSRTPSPTRKTHQRYPSEQMPFTGDGRSNGRAWAGDNSLRGGAGGLVGWLSGNGATPSDATPPKLRRGTASELSTPKSSNTTTAASRFMSALSSRFTPTTIPTKPTIADAPIDDELFNLDIEAALFPQGTPSSDRDPFSPAAFKNLHMNAAGLLRKFQTAYRERVVALNEIQAERSAQRDELEEAETRAAHLKMQLEGMARKAQENERAMKALVEDLAAERRAREEERRGAAAAAAAMLSPVDRGGGGGGGEGGSMVSEDLGVDEDRKRRPRRGDRSHRQSWKSGASGASGATCCEDDDFDDSDENESAESESVFSRCRSPALTTGTLPPPQPPQPLTPMDGPTRTAAPRPRGVNTAPKQKSGQQMSAFQKIIKGLSGDTEENAGVNGCANCQGQDASVAWNTVSLLRDENKHLKGRVGELEVAVEGALDLVNGIGL